MSTYKKQTNKQTILAKYYTKEFITSYLSAIDTYGTLRNLVGLCDTSNIPLERNVIFSRQKFKDIISIVSAAKLSVRTLWSRKSVWSIKIDSSRWVKTGKYAGVYRLIMCTVFVGKRSRQTKHIADQLNHARLTIQLWIPVRIYQNIITDRCAYELTWPAMCYLSLYHMLILN